jgi:hypothetical protein
MSFAAVLLLALAKSGASPVPQPVPPAPPVPQPVPQAAHGSDEEELRSDLPSDEHH